MGIIDFRCRPDTPEIINGIADGNMFKAACAADALATHAAMPLSDAVRRKVVYENALRVLGEAPAECRVLKKTYVF